MTISLLDVLSCGLAVVVILLIIALNTGKGYNNNPEKLTMLEIGLEGDYSISESIIVGWKDWKKQQCYVVPISRELSKIELKSPLDSLYNFFQSNIYAPDFDSIKLDNKKQKYDFLFHPKCKGIEMNLSIYSKSNFSIESRMTNISKGKTIPKAKIVDNLSGSVEVVIKYTSGVKMQILKEGRQISVWYLNNTK